MYINTETSHLMSARSHARSQTAFFLQTRRRAMTLACCVQFVKNGVAARLRFNWRPFAQKKPLVWCWPRTVGATSEYIIAAALRQMTPRCHADVWQVRRSSDALDAVAGALSTLHFIGVLGSGTGGFCDYRWTMVISKSLHKHSRKLKSDSDLNFQRTSNGANDITEWKPLYC